MLEWFMDLFRYITERVINMTYAYDLLADTYIFYLPFVIGIGAFIMYEIFKFFIKQVYK